MIEWWWLFVAFVGGCLFALIYAVLCAGAMADDALKKAADEALKKVMREEDERKKSGNNN
jgi:hypothetical protein